MTPKVPVAEGLLVENLLPKPGTASFGYLQPEVVVFRSAAHSARLYRDAKILASDCTASSSTCVISSVSSICCPR